MADTLRWRVYVGKKMVCAFPPAEAADADEAAAHVRRLMPHLAGTTLTVKCYRGKVETTTHPGAKAA